MPISAATPFLALPQDHTQTYTLLLTNKYSRSRRITPPRTGLIVKMMKGTSSFWACLLVALTHIVAISCNLQFVDDSQPPVIKDITVTIRTNSTPSFDGVVDTQSPLALEFEGKQMVTGNVAIGTHIGTHVVSPAHLAANQGKYAVDALDLKTLIGPVMVVDTPRDSNITAQVLQSLQLPPGLKRIIFRTSNTDRKLVIPPPPPQAPTFASDYTGLTADGATWLVQNSAIQFVGIDYISVGMHEEKVQVYENLFAKPEIIPVEYLKLDEVKPGMYTVYCLPLRLEYEGSPARCILVE